MTEKIRLRTLIFPAC